MRVVLPRWWSASLLLSARGGNFPTTSHAACKVVVDLGPHRPSESSLIRVAPVLTIPGFLPATISRFSVGRKITTEINIIKRTRIEATKGPETKFVVFISSEWTEISNHLHMRGITASGDRIPPDFPTPFPWLTRSIGVASVRAPS